MRMVISVCLARMDRGWFGHYKFPLHSLLCSPFHFPIVCLSNTYCHTQCVTTVWIDSGLRPSQSVCCPSLCTICLWPQNGRSKFHSFLYCVPTGLNTVNRVNCTLTGSPPRATSTYPSSSQLQLWHGIKTHQKHVILYLALARTLSKLSSVCQNVAIHPLSIGKYDHKLHISYARSRTSISTSTC